VSCHQAAAGLTLLGLVFELVAIIAILWSAGLKGWVRRTITKRRTRLQAAWIRLRRLWPWAKPVSKTMYAKAADAFALSDSAEVRVIRHPVPPPGDFEEVGRQINEIRADLNRIEEMHYDRAERIETRLDDEVSRLTQGASQQAASFDERMRKEATRQFRERRVEGVIFLIGVGFQIAGAVALLTGC
jgi:hypothetical protein